MDLKIKGVAELLNVSETTIRRWLTDGKIPAYRLNHQYRFNRSEIEDWVMKHRIGKSNEMISFHESTSSPEEDAPKGGNKQYSLFRAINKGEILRDVPGNTKEEVIRNSVKLLSKNLNLDAEVITEILLDRENLMPTALSHGIGVPHARDFLLNTHQDVVAVVFPEKPIQYGALDGEPVHTLFFLFACEGKRHLHLLAKIAHLSSLPESIPLLKTKPSKEQILEYVENWESKIKKEG